ncbi:hypothetical protein BDN72DRAFT_132660 [Pluteus cervinus]|uniref:Uncharacterized protein n=1 Tax=Pluteus cervinus TaxID=181527 RepID=A0ACD3AMF2_9AGAR|nr:hypothetical protein BDN72DRAFT_132660 [Pluteus cervinus]
MAYSNVRIRAYRLVVFTGVGQTPVFIGTGYLSEISSCQIRIQDVRYLFTSYLTVDTFSSDGEVDAVRMHEYHGHRQQKIRRLTDWVCVRVREQRFSKFGGFGPLGLGRPIHVTLVSGIPLPLYQSYDDALSGLTIATRT